MDAVAAAFVDLLVSQETLPAVVNLVHPRAVAWKEVMHDINNQLDAPLPIIPFGDWVTKLEAVAEAADAKQLETIVSDPYSTDPCVFTLTLCS